MLKKAVKKLLSSGEQRYEDESSALDIKVKQSPIQPNLDKTLNTFKSIYSYPDNMDVTIREFFISGINKKAAMLSINTITDPQLIDEHILNPLLINDDPSKKIEQMISIPFISRKKIVKDVLVEINKGNAIVFIDGEEIAFSINVSNFQGRNVERPENENVIKGPKEAFVEKADTNISLVRKRIKSENLIVESATISKRSKNDVYILYEKDLVNDALLEKVKKRVMGLDVDSIQNLSLLEQHIEDRKLSLFPTVLYTERPDRATSFIENGYIILLMDNSPASLVVPATFWSFYHTSEDHYLRLPFANFTRFLRIFAIFITLFTSAIYIAMTTFHAEMIPPDLLLAIAATREKVPFTALVEVIIMELAFELIREAGLRVPTPLGPTIGIVGALVLGQAAVNANIVSPIVVIVVALSAVSSFAIADISLNYTFRISRFFVMFSAGLFGVYGMTALFAIGLFYIVSIKSFGVPYLSPLTPKYVSSGDTVFRKLIKNELFRPGYVKPKDMEKKQGDV